MDTLIDIGNIPAREKNINEWYTPARYVEAARRVMGGIDLDPASCEEANQAVKAVRYYTEQLNGLTQQWCGRVWLNPPYSSSLSPAGMNGGKQQGPTGLFISKLINSFECGDVSQAIVCVNADTVRAWFQPLWNHLICFVSFPIQFYRPGQKPEHHFFGSVFAYLGPNNTAFIKEFSQFGPIAKRLDTPKPKPVMLDLWTPEIAAS